MIKTIILNLEGIFQVQHKVMLENHMNIINWKYLIIMYINKEL